MRLTATYCAELERVHMQPLNAAGRTYEVERRAYHAARPGFRIAEMQISPTQTDTLALPHGRAGYVLRHQRNDTRICARAERRGVPNGRYDLFYSSGTSLPCR